MRFWKSCAAAVTMLVAVHSANAIVYIDFVDGVDGLDVTVSGTLNTAGVGTWNNYLFDSGKELTLEADRNLMWVYGPDGGNYQYAPHFGITSSWLSIAADGDYTLLNHSGDDIGFWSSMVMVPLGYVSGSPISASFTIQGLDMASLDPVPGPALTMGNGDSIVITPEPTSLAILALGGLLTSRRRR